MLVTPPFSACLSSNPQKKSHRHFFGGRLLLGEMLSLGRHSQLPLFNRSDGEFQYRLPQNSASLLRNFRAISSNFNELFENLYCINNCIMRFSRPTFNKPSSPKNSVLANFKAKLLPETNAHISNTNAPQIHKQT